jgi:hypothetical protein
MKNFKKSAGWDSSVNYREYCDFAYKSKGSDTLELQQEFTLYLQVIKDVLTLYILYNLNVEGHLNMNTNQ